MGRTTLGEGQAEGSQNNKGEGFLVEGNEKKSMFITSSITYCHSKKNEIGGPESDRLGSLTIFTEVTSESGSG